MNEHSVSEQRERVRNTESGSKPMSHRASVESESDVVYRLPEVRAVRGDVRDGVVQTFIDVVPDYFWIARASSSHHPPDERELGGLWLHTKRVFTAYRMLEPTFRAMSAITSFQSNCARAAVLLHDAFKYRVTDEYERVQDDIEYGGHDYGNGYLDHLPTHTVTTHDVQMADYVRSETDLPEEVARCVECHGGSPDWYSHDGPGPDSDLTLAVHLADVFASNSEHRLPVVEPCTELQMMVGDVSTVSSEWVEELNEF